MWELKTRHETAGVENTGVERRQWKTQEWKTGQQNVCVLVYVHED